MHTTIEAAQVCSKCGRRVKTSRTPSGWKRRGDKLFCSNCWRQRYVLRAISLPVAQPVNNTWEELRTALKEAWADTTRASNWIITQLYARDIRREAGVQKMPSMPNVYLYPELREQFPSLTPQSVASIEQALKRKYRARRYEVVWTCAAALPTTRYPAPFPVHNQSWSTEVLDGNKPAVNVRIGRGRFLLRLKGGPQFRRQRAEFDLIHAGEAVPGELAIYQRRDTLMVKIAAWLPRETPGPSPRRGTLFVRTDAHSLLVALNAEDDGVWIYNGDHLVRWAAQHRRQLQRWNEDTKYENRPIPKFAVRREEAAWKYRNRMNSATHEISEQLARYAARHRFATVRYDDQERTYLAEFPWYRLKALIIEKLNAHGIGFEVATGEVGVEASRE